MRGEYDAHAGLRHGARNTAHTPKPSRPRLPLLTVVKWLAIAAAAIVVASHWVKA